MSFAKSLKKWRGKRLQKQASDALGVPERTYASWERGERVPGSVTIIELKRRMDGNK